MRRFFISAFALPLLTSAAMADGNSVLFHNGSQMRLALAGSQVEIRYAVPKPSLAVAGVGPGTLLFLGKLGADNRLEGQAFTFKRNCAPAPYVVSGVVQGAEFFLTGFAPQRARIGCAIIGYSEQSGHAVLAFEGLNVSVLSNRTKLSEEAQLRARWEATGASAEKASGTQAATRDANPTGSAVTQPTEFTPVAATQLQQTSPQSAAPTTSVLASTVATNPPPATAPAATAAPGSPKPTPANVQDAASEHVSSQPAPSLPAPTPEPVSVKLADIDYAGLLDAYVRFHPEIRDQKQAVESIWTLTHCREYRQLQFNEFRRGEFLAAAPAFVAAMGSQTQQFRFRIHAQLGEYDVAQGAFAFKPNLNGSNLRIGPSDACIFPNGAPGSFVLRFQDVNALDTLPMPPAEAEAFVRSRTFANGAVNRGIVLELMVEPQAIERASGLDPAVQLGVNDMRVFADDRTAAPIASFSPARKAAILADRQARMAAEAEDVRTIRPFGPQTLAEDAQSYRDHAAPLDPRPVRWSASFTPLQINGALFIIKLEPTIIEDMVPNPGQQPNWNRLTFVNNDEVNALILPADMQAELAKGGKRATLNYIYTPVGYGEDPEMRVTTIFAHADALEISLTDQDGAKTFRINTQSRSKPTALPIDVREPTDFEVAGIRLGQSAEVVKPALEKAFGERMNYDEAQGVIVSANSACTSTPLVISTPRNPCIALYFGKVGSTFFGKEIRGLVRLEIGQRFSEYEFNKFVGALHGQFGQPRARRGDYLSWVDVWGKKLAPRFVNALAPAPNAPAVQTNDKFVADELGQHVAQLEAKQAGNDILTRFVLTDQVFVQTATPGQ
jgi:hypothetical protein